MEVPCLCSGCGFEFAAPGFLRGVGEGSFALSGITTPCPRCGGTARVGAGTYSYQNDNIVGLEGSPITKALASRLGIIVDRAKDDRLTKLEMLAEIADINPDLAEKLRNKKGIGVAAIILILIMIIKAVTLNITIDVNRLIDQVTGAPEGDNLPDYDSATIPDSIIVKEPPKSTIAAGPTSNPPNRKERLRQASLAKRRGKKNA